MAALLAGLLLLLSMHMHMSTTSAAVLPLACLKASCCCCAVCRGFQVLLPWELVGLRRPPSSTWNTFTATICTPPFSAR